MFTGWKSCNGMSFRDVLWAQCCWFDLYTFPRRTQTFTDPSIRERLSQAETSRGKINTEKHLLYAMGVILRIYMQSLVMSFILETLEELAILKNFDVRVKYSIVMG